MVGKVTAEMRFGQMMICLRESKLNYLMKETPYSAEITIRKKFLKNVIENAFEKVENLDSDKIERYEVSDKLKQVEKENSLLKQNMKDLERKCGMHEFDLEDMEVKKEALETEKNSLEEQVETVYAENRELRKTNNDLQNELIKARKETKLKSLESTKKFEIVEKSKKEAEDNILMLENVVKVVSRGLGWTRLIAENSR